MSVVVADLKTVDLLCQRHAQHDADDDDGCKEADRLHVWVADREDDVGGNEELVTERQLNQNLYEMMLPLADPARSTIHKIRHSFIWQGQYFEIDNYLDQLKGLTILETKGITANEPVKFPPFLKVLREVTGDKDYYNYNLATR